MDLFSFGRIGSLFGLPVAFALLISSFVNIYAISGLLSLVQPSMPYLKFHYLGTLISSSFNFPRIYMLIKLATSVLWGLIVVLNISIFRRSILIAYVGLGFAYLFYGEVCCGLAYGIYAFFRDEFIDMRPSYRRRIGKLTFDWSTQFWLSLAGNVVVYTLIASLVLDLHWSYIQILAHKGSGWENKAYFEIHQSEGDTVATLQAQWDARMGIQGRPGAAERAQVARPTATENSPLMTDA